MKTYVVIGSYGDYEEYKEDVLYAGNDKEKAESFKIDGIYEELVLMVWVNGVCIQEFYKKQIKWILAFDKTTTLKNDVATLREELKHKEKLLKQLEEIEE
jgi:hypothetical protein